MSERAERCETCRWFETAGQDIDIGYCHRYAPHPGVEAADTDEGIFWPQVWKDSWCGEWEEREKSSVEMKLGECGCDFCHHRLTNRALRVFENLKLTTFKELASKSPNDILNVKNTGHTTLAELRRFLADHGLHFAHDRDWYDRRVKSQNEKLVTP